MINKNIKRKKEEKATKMFSCNNWISKASPGTSCQLMKKMNARLFAKINKSAYLPVDQRNYEIQFSLLFYFFRHTGSTCVLGRLDSSVVGVPVKQTIFGWRGPLAKVNAIIFTNPSARAGYDTWSIFK